LLRRVFLYRPQQQILRDVIEGHRHTLPTLGTFPSG
jgi:hypothetical protein